ncbi:MAG: glycosyltransferase family 2 protein [Gaiellaceae bacterium]
MRVVGVVLVRNEDVFVEQAVRNVAAFCDRIHVVDHLSTDRTPEILRGLALELDHVTVERSSDAGDSHRAIEGYAGTPTWALGVDGDELYDPGALARLRDELEAGAHADVFRLKGHVLNCKELDETQGLASGYLAPPSRPVTKLFNLGAVETWTGCLERLHDGDAVFRPGFGWESLRYLSEERDWESDPLRMVHTCFLRRSSGDTGEQPSIRLGLPETGAWKRGPRGILHRLRKRRHLDPRIKEYVRAGSSWKQEWYARGARVTVDARPFLEPASRNRAVGAVSAP